MLFTLYFRGGVRRDARPPHRGPVIFVANHNSLLDGVLIHGVIVRPLRIFIAREWAEWWPIRGLTRSLGAIHVVQGQRNPVAFDAARAALERGQAVILFPEGGIQRDGRLGRFRFGAARLAFATGAPVYPCAINGSYEAMPWPRHFPRPRRITLRCGSPILLDRTPIEEIKSEELIAATDRIRSAVQALIERGHGN